MLINVIGCDPSLTHTVIHHAFGVGDSCAVPDRFKRAEFKGALAKFANPVARLVALKDAFRDSLTECGAFAGSPGLFVVEGYAFGASNNREALGEWGGVIRTIAYEQGWSILVVPPTTLKKFVLGKGVGEKNLMLRDISKAWGYDATDDDDGDAYALMRLGVEYQHWLTGEKVLQRHADLFEPRKVKKKRKRKGEDVIVEELQTSLTYWAARACGKSRTSPGC